MTLDDAALKAGVDLVRRTGARGFEVGYLHDDVPSEQAGWYAHAQYQGARILVENQPGPIEAVEALARRLLTGARCVRCGGLVALSDHGAVAYAPGAPMADGSTWDGRRAALRFGQCRWRRVGARWEMGCQRSRSSHSTKRKRRR